jgi:2-keto-4-pentenoate hydratase/2-oxohepta-3-ene-1,7-dioic acid hydratase in catechol pathway
MQDSNTQDLIFNISKLVSYLSRGMTLMPGTVIMSGTPAGVGAARKPPVFLADGDVIEVEVEGIGVLRNPVADQTLRGKV